MSKTKKIVFTVLLGALVVLGVYLFIIEINEVIGLVRQIIVDGPQSFGVYGDFEYYFVFSIYKALDYGPLGIVSYNINSSILHCCYCIITITLLLIVIYKFIKYRKKK